MERHLRERRLTVPRAPARRGGAALASIAIGFRFSAAAVSPSGAGVSPSLRRAGAAGTAAARVRFGAR